MATLLLLFCLEEIISHRVADPPLGIRIERVVLISLEDGMAVLEVRGRYRNLETRAQKFRLILTRGREELGKSNGYLSGEGKDSFAVSVRIRVPSDNLRGVRAQIEFY